MELNRKFASIKKYMVNKQPQPFCSELFLSEQSKQNHKKSIRPPKGGEVCVVLQTTKPHFFCGLLLLCPIYRTQRETNNALQRYLPHISQLTILTLCVYTIVLSRTEHC